MTLAEAAAVLVTINMSANAQASAGGGIHAPCKTPRRSSNRWHAKAPAPTAGPAMSEPAARIVAGAVRATDRMIAFSERLPLAASRRLILECRAGALISIKRRAKI
jgi:hypothetical protein